MEIKEIKNTIREEYEKIEKEVLKKTAVSSSDGNFIKIEIRIKTPKEITLGISRTVSFGERDWIIDSILGTPNIPEIPMGKEKDLVYSILTNLDYSGGTILIPASFYLKIIQDKYNDIKFQAPWNQLSGNNIIPISDNKLKKIILINNLGVLWEGVKDRVSNSFLMINEIGEDLEIYTLNHLHIFPENIKILNP